MAASVRMSSDPNGGVLNDTPVAELVGQVGNSIVSICRP